MWSLMLQCRFTGKAQEVCAALSVSLNYDVLKGIILQAYELVLKVYLQHFREYVEFAREKSVFFDK